MSADVYLLLERLLILLPLLIAFMWTGKIAGVHVTTPALFTCFLLVLAVVGAMLRPQRLRIVSQWLRESHRRERRMYVAAGVFWLAGLLSFFPALDKLLWARELAQITLFFALAFLVRVFALRSVKARTFCLAILLGASVVSLMGIIEYFIGSFFVKESLEIGVRVRSQVNFGHPNNLGAYLAGVIPVGLALTARPARGRGLALLATVPVIMCIVCTFSRAGWIGALIGIIVVTCALGRSVLKPLGILVTIAVLWVGLLWVDARAERNRFKYTGIEGSGLEIYPVQKNVLVRGGDSVRFAFLRVGLGIVKEHPLISAVGLGNASLAAGSRLEQMENAPPEEAWRPLIRGGEGLHNTALQVWVETGIFGLAAGLAAVYYLFMSVLSGRLSTKCPEQLAGMAGACAALLVASAFGWLFTRGIGDLFFLCAGLTLAIAHLNRRQ